MAFHLLQQRRQDGLMLAKILEHTLKTVANCQRCRNFSEETLCPICVNPKRDNSLLCIVESPIDIFAIEQSYSYRGLYFTLMGHLSPIDGLGPNEIGIGELTSLLKSELPNLQEVIIATNPTVEGEATAHYIANLVRSLNIAKCTRIAHGIPFGGELEYTDSNTLAQAIVRRIEI
jgi:recombination protein RecR